MANEALGRRNRKVAVTRWPGGDMHLQIDGRDIGMKAVRSSVLADMEARATGPVKVDVLDVYLKPSDNRAYYAANGPTGPVSGSVSL